MPKTARGAVLRAFNEPLTLEAAPVPDPEPGALVAKVDLAGICFTILVVHPHGSRVPSARVEIRPPTVLVFRRANHETRRANIDHDSPVAHGQFVAVLVDLEGGKEQGEFSWAFDNSLLPIPGFHDSTE